MGVEGVVVGVEEKREELRPLFFASRDRVFEREVALFETLLLFSTRYVREGFGPRVSFSLIPCSETTN